MKPGLPEILIGGAMTLGGNVAPHIAAGYAVGSLSTVCLLMIFAAQEADRAADVLAKENAALRALFAEAANAPLNKDLQTDLKAAGAGGDESLRVSALESANQALKRTLITLQGAVEEADAAWARALNRRIWAILKDGADARALFIPPI